MFIPAALIMAALAGAPAGAQVPPTPQAQVAAGLVTHPAERITIRLPETAVHVGSERFSLYDVADAEVHVFVDADAEKRMRRLWWIQFESYLPSRPDARYNYGESDRRMDLWGATAWVRPSLADSARQVRPGSDTERFRAILTRAGYTAPPHLLAVRMVRLLDDSQDTGHGRRELMLIYAEDPAVSGVALSQVTTGGRPNARFAKVEGPLIERAAAAFVVNRD